MRTSELKKIVEDNGFQFEKGSRIIYIKSGGLVYIRLLTDSYFDMQMVNGTSILTKSARTVAKACLEYLETPLEEREKEKKYYLKFPKEFSNCGYLNFKTDDNKYLVSGKIQEWNYKTQFTQKEIDEMPFDTNFFEKVLVE